MALKNSAARVETPQLATPAMAAGALAPPFWELEGLLAAGRDRAEALAIMGARRSRPEPHPLACNRNAPALTADIQPTARRLRAS